jgi:hypothetical protein
MFKADDPLPTDEDLIASIPYATDTFETYAQSETKLLIAKAEEPDEQTEKAKGIERGIRSMANTYGCQITIDPQSLTTLSEKDVTTEQIALAFRSHLSRFGSLPPSLAVLIQRGCFA